MLKKIAYGAIGFSGSALLIANLLVSMPETHVASSPPTSQIETGFESDERDEGLPHWGEAENGEVVRGDDLPMPTLFETYHVQAQDVSDMQEENIVTYGRDNPMGYVKRVAEGEETSVSFSWDDVVNQAAVAEGNTLGYDTSISAATEKKQIVSVAVTDMEGKFREYGVLPVDETHFSLTSDFGPRVDPINGKQEVFHGGMDIAASGIGGKKAYSVLPGAVSYVGNSPDGYGNHIIVNHDGFETLYGHLSELPTLEVGAIVQAGDTLGTIGSTGRSTGPHLHLEVVVDGVKVDPKPFIALVGKKENRNEPKQTVTVTTPTAASEKEGETAGEKTPSTKKSTVKEEK